jgi:RNA polymerase sigma-70 factor (ECF subfamily)
MSSHSEFDARLQANLVSAAAAGDADAIAELYDATFANVYAFAFRTARNQQDAEDITSETYERALRKLHSYRSGDVPLIVWLIRIARNVAYENARKAKRGSVVALTPSVAEQVTARPESAGLSPADLDTLTPAQREVISLRLAGFKIREIAATLGKAEGTVKALQFSAMKRLREGASHE